VSHKEDDVIVQEVERSLYKCQNSIFLTNQIFRKTYVAAKKEIDEWLRAYTYHNSKKGNASDSKQALFNANNAKGTSVLTEISVDEFKS